MDAGGYKAMPRNGQIWASFFLRSSLRRNHRNAPSKYILPHTYHDCITRLLRLVETENINDRVLQTALTLLCRVRRSFPLIHYHPKWSGTSAIKSPPKRPWAIKLGMRSLQANNFCATSTNRLRGYLLTLVSYNGSWASCQQRSSTPTLQC